VLDAARAQGFDVIVAAIKEETSPEIDRKARFRALVFAGELSKLIDTFKAEGVTRAVMAGQVKHKQIFSAIKPDWRLAKLLLSLGTRNTDSLLGAVAKVLAGRWHHARELDRAAGTAASEDGVLSKRAPSGQERRTSNMDAQWRGGSRSTTLGRRCDRRSGVRGGRGDGRHGCDDRAGRAADAVVGCGIGCGGEASTLSRALTVVKIAKPKQDMRFDVPVIGVKTIETMVRAGASCLAVDADDVCCWMARRRRGQRMRRESRCARIEFVELEAFHV